MVVASLALFVALDGPATAARLIDGASIRKNSITNREVRNHTLGVQDLSRTAVKTLQTTGSRSVGSRQLRAGAVDATKLAPGAVGNAQIAGKAVDAGKIADGTVGPTQLATNAVTSTKVADGAIGAAAIADGGLQTRDLGDFYGSVSVPFGDFKTDECKVVTIPAQPAAGTQGNSIADDIVIASPTTSGWPDPIIVTANPGANNTVRIVACRIGGGVNTDPPISAPVTTFYYVAFDTP
jgi:hypothetical protein